MSGDDDAVALGAALWEEARALVDIRDAFPQPAVTEAEYQAATLLGAGVPGEAWQPADSPAILRTGG